MGSNIRTYVTSTADVVRVVSLKPGDVYKRLVESAYGDPKLQLGIVTAVLNNGDKVAVSAIEYATSYSGVDAKVEVFTESRDVSIFPADPAEIASHLDEIGQAAERKVASAESDLMKAREALAAVRSIIERTSTQALTAADSETIQAAVTS